jgi:hypothetical protein
MAATNIFGRLAKAGALRLVDLSGYRRDLAALHQLSASLDQQALPPPLLRKAVNEITGASQTGQILLCLRYQELLRQKQPLPDLSAVEFRCFSQGGEDGLLLYLFSLLGTTDKRAVEICAGDGIECNSANLIINHGWRGLLFDGDAAAVRTGQEFYALCRDTFIAPPTLVAAWITAENVNALLAERGFVGDIDLLSLDMDGVDWWVWKALTVVRPRVVILECNPTWGPHLAVTIPYKPDFRTDYTKRPWYQGASLAAFAKLGRDKGYRLVGLHRLGNNALFLRNDVGPDLFPEVSPAECFQRNLRFRDWSPARLPDPAENPEWGEVVEV